MLQLQDSLCCRRKRAREREEIFELNRLTKREGVQKGVQCKRVELLNTQTVAKECTRGKDAIRSRIFVDLREIIKYKFLYSRGCRRDWWRWWRSPEAEKGAKKKQCPLEGRGEKSKGSCRRRARREKCERREVGGWRKRTFLSVPKNTKVWGRPGFVSSRLLSPPASPRPPSTGAIPFAFGLPLRVPLCPVLSLLFDCDLYTKPTTGPARVVVCAASITLSYLSNW